MDEPELIIGDRVVLADIPLTGKHDRADHVGTVEGFDGDAVLVRMSGPDAPEGTTRYHRKLLERWDG